jgi:hypothetical protein
MWALRETARNCHGDKCPRTAARVPGHLFRAFISYGTGAQAEGNAATGYLISRDDSDHPERRDAQCGPGQLVCCRPVFVIVQNRTGSIVTSCRFLPIRGCFASR